MTEPSAEQAKALVFARPLIGNSPRLWIPPSRVHRNASAWPAPNELPATVPPSSETANAELWFEPDGLPRPWKLATGFAPTACASARTTATIERRCNGMCASRVSANDPSEGGQQYRAARQGGGKRYRAARVGERRDPRLGIADGVLAVADNCPTVSG